MMIQERFANTLPFCGVKDGHDALLVAAHTFMIDAGYKCTGIGQEIPDSPSSISTESLPQGWNSSPELYAIQYKSPSSYHKIFLMKVLRLETVLAFHVLDVDQEKSVDLMVDISDYIIGDKNNLLQHLFDYKQVVKKFEQFHQVFKNEITSKLESQKEKPARLNTNRCDTSRQIIYPDDPLRIPPRQPLIHERQQPSILDPRGYGDRDLLPGHLGAGGMLMDPFNQQRGRHSQGYPGLPRGTVPPGARFDPFGPDVEMGGDHRQRRFREPGPDHLNPPGFEDDMFM
ncbi:proteasome inhibitor PI31 subunit-like [Xenia sp. Carnegie-2017]|uniref:proteasome inhibitor PI31 subunit-like n=1 Tax=Xenia sp. Carnegie-2017 TaxID=2897299 RepID=UPI001F03FDF8|nr:proteasome inhibitor PI31 subunit-like [Xenia sp. Carnegie-2017]